MTVGVDVAIPFPSGRPDEKKLTRALEFLRPTDKPLRHRFSFVCPLLKQADRWHSDPTYLCGSDEERVSELVEMWSGSHPKIVWCGRGGYGATRLLGRLEAALAGIPLTYRKRFLGYSDITGLFAFIRSKNLPIDCVHAPVVTEIPDHPQPDLIYWALGGTPCPLPVKNAGDGTAAFDGPIWGGNLAVLASLCGTPWLPKIENGAIFLEDIDEAPYRLDRFVTQLEDSGFFSHVEGVFLGQFTKCGLDNAGLKAVKQRLLELEIPFLGELPVGHEALHLPLFFDLSYKFEAGSGTLQPQGNRVDALTIRTAPEYGAIDRG